MEYKTIQELYLAVGVAGAIIVVFLAIFVYLIVNENKKRNEQLDRLIEKVANLQLNDVDLKATIQLLAENTKELSNSSRLMADTVNKLDFYNKDMHKTLEKHDEKANLILEKINKVYEVIK